MLFRSGLLSFATLFVFLISMKVVDGSKESGKDPFPMVHSSTSSKQANWTTSAKLSLKGFGPIKIGMTLEEARKAIVDPLKHNPEEGEECFYVTPSGIPEGLSFMVTDGRISRIDITSPAYCSMRGARVGQTQDQVIKLYEGKLEITKHKYDMNGFYLTFIPIDKADQQYRMVFETDGKQITCFRAGKLPEVEFVEGSS